MGLFLWVQSISGWHLNGHVTIPSHIYRTENQCTGTYVVIMSQNLLTNDYLILGIGWQKREKKNKTIHSKPSICASETFVI